MSTTDQRRIERSRRYVILIAAVALLLGTGKAPARAEELQLLGGLSFLTGHHTGAGSYQIEWNLPAALTGQADPTTVVSISGYPYRNPDNYLTVRKSFTQSGRATLVLQELAPTGEPVAGQPAPVGFSVEVTNIATGVGQWRSRVDVVPGAPSRLTDVVAESGADDTVTVTWSPPAHATAGPLDQVRLECLRLGIVAAHVQAVAEPGRASINCGQGGHLRVRGHNPAGWGSPSELPEPAHGLAVTVLSPTRALADWQADGFDPTVLVAPPRVRITPSGTRRAWLDSPHNANHRVQVHRSNIDGQSVSRPMAWSVPPAAPTLAAVRVAGAGAAEVSIVPSELNRETSEGVTYEVFADGSLVCAVAGRTDQTNVLRCSTGPLTRLDGARFTAVAHSLGGTSVTSPELVLSGSAPQALPEAGAPSPAPGTVAPQATPTGAPEPVTPGGPRIALSAKAATATITARVNPAGTGKRPWQLWLQRRVEGRWLTVAHHTIKTATTTFKYLPSGTYRGWTPAQHGYPAAGSPTFEYRAAAAEAEVSVAAGTILMRLTASGPPGTKLARLRYTVSRRSPWTGKWTVIGRYRSAKPKSGSSHNRIIIKGSGAFRISIANQGRFLGYKSPDLTVS